MQEPRGNYDPKNPLWVVVKYRDTGLIRCIGQHAVHYSKQNMASWGKRAKYVTVANQWDWVTNKPEDFCIFIESHQIIRAKSAEEAVKLWQQN